LESVVKKVVVINRVVVGLVPYNNAVLVVREIVVLDSGI
jgi:hypothetical protein